MPGQRLMCVWETASVMFTVEKGQSAPDVHTLKALSVILLQDGQYVKFYSSLFEELFNRKDITLDKFKTYIRQCVTDELVPFSRIEDEIEAKCWQQCRAHYNLKPSGFEESLAKQLWQIYIRLTDADSYPTVIQHQDLDWFTSHMESSMEQNASQVIINKEKKEVSTKLKFPDFLMVVKERFVNKYSDKTLKNTIEEMYSWLVQEISMAGWLSKRKRKQNNWTGWLQRWFILSPGKLTYYDGPKCEVKKGELAVTSKSVLDELPLQKKTILFKKASPVFKLSNKPYIDMEMRASDENEYKAWVASIKDMIESSMQGSTPVQMLLEKRQVEDRETKLTEIKIRSRTVKRISHGWYEFDNSGSKEAPLAPLQLTPLSLDEEDVETELIKEARERIRTLFNGCDADGNGYIDRSEFRKFIKAFGRVDLDNDELDEVYDSIDRDHSDSLTFDKFYDYFVKFILGSVHETSFVENKLKMEFLKAEREGKSAVNFQQLVEATQEQQRSEGRDMLVETLKEMADEDGEVPLEGFKQLLKTCPEASSARKNNLKRRLKSVYQKTDLQNMADYIKERWEKFSSFKRYGASGDLVMKGSSGMVADVLPGQYNLLDLACFSDGMAIQPKHVVIKGAKWVKSPDPGRSGMVIFPSDYNGTIPVDIATTEHARYYGCSLADSTQVKVSLLYRHGIQDFTYQQGYLNDYVQEMNGPGLETHEFSHLDCPLEDDSGHFILGKMVSGPKHEELHMTAFIVPTRHTLYVPGSVIHSNDYLTGTWRTMLSDEADIDHYHMVKSSPNIRNELVQPFTFKMTGKYANLTTARI